MRVSRFIRWRAYIRIEVALLIHGATDFAEARKMRFRPTAAGAASIALAVAATLLPWPSLAGESPDAEPSNRSAPPVGTTAQPSAPDATADRSKIATTPGAVKDTPPPVSDASGLSGADLAKRIILRCRTRPELCAKQPNEGEVEPPNGPAADDGAHK
jgi:hypothetical protein